MQIREVAAATARHKNFLADLVRTFQDGYASAPLTRDDGTHQSSGTAAKNDDIEVMYGH